MKRLKKKDFEADSLRRRSKKAGCVILLSVGAVTLLMLAWLLTREAGFFPTTRTGTITSVEVNDDVRKLVVRHDDGTEQQFTTNEQALFKQRGKSAGRVSAKDLVVGVKISVSYHSFGAPPYRLSAVQVLRR